MWLVPDVPVLLHVQIAILRDQIVSRKQLVDVLVDRLRSDPVTEGEKVRQPVQVEFSGDRRVSKEGLDLRCEDDSGLITEVIERFLPDAITSQEQGSGAPVPDGEG